MDQIINSSTTDHLKKSIIGLVAGINGGIATVLVGQPLDTVKVKMQTFPELYTNAWQCIRATLLKDGFIRGLYAGTVPALVANVAENAVLFCALPPCEHFVRYTCSTGIREPMTVLQHASAGSLAAVWSTLVLCPTEMVKCKVQAMREMSELGLIKFNCPSEIGPWAVTSSIFRQSGINGFFRGLLPTFAREVPGYFCFFGGYESSRTFVAQRMGRRKEDLHPLVIAACGAVGGAMLWISIFPFDVVKSRMQVGHIEATKHSEGVAVAKVESRAPTNTNILPKPPVNEPNFYQCLLKIVRHEGVTALYRGLGPTLLRTIPGSGALFVAVEWTRKAGHWLSN